MGGRPYALKVKKKKNHSLAVLFLDFNLESILIAYYNRTDDFVCVCMCVGVHALMNRCGSCR